MPSSKLVDPSQTKAAPASQKAAPEQIGRANLQPDSAATNSEPTLEEQLKTGAADLYAAIDLGSNSFHLVISRYEHGEFNVIDRQREVVRLAGGLDKHGNLDEATAIRALDCLQRFGQLLSVVPNNQVRAVGTNALRRMKNKPRFLDVAERALGHSIEIIAGREEARLIYLGVSKWSAGQEDARLVIDIGGGSTEIIAGRGEVADCRESTEVGCVVLSNQFFKDGKLSRKRFKKAKLAAELAIQPVVKQFRMQGWRQVLGCSGTMKSINNVLIESGWSRDGITADALNVLLEELIATKHIDKLQIAGLTKERAPVLPGGLAILLALVELFDIEQISVSDIALREGVLYDLVGRSSAEDIRDVTVAAMLSKWGVRSHHGEQVDATVRHLYEQVAPQWDISGQWFLRMLSWAAQLHELGLLVSHDGYHDHGAYIVENADMAGFARLDQLVLASLIAGHRRKFPLNRFESLPSNLVTPVKRMAVLLRLAVLLHRERSQSALNLPEIEVQGQSISLEFGEGVLQDKPLTKADLEQEQAWLKGVGIRLNFR